MIDQKAVIRQKARSLAPKRTGVDQAIVARWAKAIVEDDLKAIRTAFASRGARGPQLVWHPSIDLLHAPQLRFLLAYWSKLAAAKGLPLASEVDPVAMREALGYVSLMDVVTGGFDFRYRVYGTTIAAVSQVDMTGRNLSEHPASPYIVEFSLAVYRAALKRRMAVFTQHTPGGVLSVSAWQRLILPLVDEAGEINRILSCNVPVPRDGHVLPARF